MASSSLRTICCLERTPHKAFIALKNNADSICKLSTIKTGLARVLPSPALFLFQLIQFVLNICGIIQPPPDLFFQPVEIKFVLRMNDTDSIDIELIRVSVLPRKNTLNDFVKLNKCGFSRHNHPVPSLVSLEVKRYREINCPFFHDCVLLNIIILSFPSDVYFGIAMLRYRKQHIKELFFSVPQSQNFGQRV